jgi:hypothetical protein
MKSILSTAILVFGLSASAYQTGTYECGNEKFNFKYVIKTIDAGNVTTPHLDVTKTFKATDSTPEKTYRLRGIPTHFTNDEGKEILVLGNTTLELTNGRPSCGSN